MKRNRIVATSVAAAFALGLGLTACSSDDAGSDDGAKEATSTDQLAGWEESAKKKTGQTVRVWLIQPSADGQGPANDYLKAEFEKQFPGNTLTIEEQQWGTYKDKYLSTLAGSDAPDVVEMGNTDTPAFTAAGALLDLTAQYDDLGGKDLLQGFVDIGTFEKKFYAPPYYSGARVVFYDADSVTDPVPTTLDEYVAEGVKLKKDDYSGIYLPGKDWYNVLPYVWENGGFIAEQGDDGKWKAGFSSEGGIKGLTQAQEVYTKANSQKVAPADKDEAKGTDVFCEGKIGYLAGPTWLGGSIQAAPDAEVPGCGDTYGKNLKTFVLPGIEAGTAAATFAGGSNLGIPAKSKNTDLAYGALKIIEGAGYQDLIAEKSFLPGLTTSNAKLPTDEVTQQGAEAAKNARLTPASPKWSTVESSNYIKDAFTKIAQGGDVTEIAKALDAQIESTLNG